MSPKSQCDAERICVIGSLSSSWSLPGDEPGFDSVKVRAACCSCPWQEYPAWLLHWILALKVNVIQKATQVLFEFIEGDLLDCTGSFLKKRRKKENMSLGTQMSNAGKHLTVSSKCSQNLCWGLPADLGQVT